MSGHNGLARDPAPLGTVAENPSMEGAVSAVREILGLEVAFASEFVGDRQVLRTISGEAESFGMAVGLAVDCSDLYCRRILSGKLPRVLTDVRGHDVAAGIAATKLANVGAFISVPIKLAGGQLYGTLCAASHDPQPALADRDALFMQVLARLIADQIDRERLEDAARALHLQAASTAALSAALAARDGYTGEHSEAVVDLAVEVGRRLGLDEEQLGDVRRSALLHDIGKLAVPDSILHKNGPLDSREWEMMRRHPVFAAEMVAGVPGLAHLAPMLRAEHERWDGRGYPDGLARDEIPIASRITLVCDAYHAMTSDRPYRRAIGHDAALAEIASGAGTQFCPVCSAALLTELDAASAA